LKEKNGHTVTIVNKGGVTILGDLSLATEEYIDLMVFKQVIPESKTSKPRSPKMLLMNSTVSRRSTPQAAGHCEQVTQWHTKQTVPGTKPAFMIADVWLTVSSVDVCSGPNAFS
jgi:hypothetical protein